MLKRSLVAATALIIVTALGASASPASAVAATGRAAEPSPALAATARPDVRRVGTAPAWVRIDNATVDWEWLKAGWEIRFSKSETGYISAGAGFCSDYLSLFRHPALKILSMGCAVLSFYAQILGTRGRCLSAFVPLNLVAGFSVGSRAC